MALLSLGRQSGIRWSSAARWDRPPDRDRRTALLAGPKRRRQEHAAPADSWRDRARRGNSSVSRDWDRAACLRMFPPDTREPSLMRWPGGSKRTAIMPAATTTASGSALASRDRAGGAVRGALLGHEAARLAGAGHRQRPRYPAPGRAHQPPGHRVDSLARDLPAAVRRTIVFVTHDRVFLERLATRIVELDRGRLSDWACDYPTFLKRRDELLAAEERQWGLFDKKLAQEEAWIRKGIEARRTRNEGRVRALEAMRRAASKGGNGRGPPDSSPGGRAIWHAGDRGRGCQFRLPRAVRPP